MIVTGIINDTVTMAQAFMGQIGGPQDLHGADKSRATAYFRRGTKVNEADNHSFRRSAYAYLRSAYAYCHDYA